MRAARMSKRGLVTELISGVDRLARIDSQRQIQVSLISGMWQGDFRCYWGIYAPFWKTVGARLM